MRNKRPSLLIAVLYTWLEDAQISDVSDDNKCKILIKF